MGIFKFFKEMWTENEISSIKRFHCVLFSHICCAIFLLSPLLHRSVIFFRLSWQLFTTHHLLTSSSDATLWLMGENETPLLGGYDVLQRAIWHGSLLRSFFCSIIFHKIIINRDVVFLVLVDDSFHRNHIYLIAINRKLQYRHEDLDGTVLYYSAVLKREVMIFTYKLLLLLFDHRIPWVSAHGSPPPF